jgi:alpha-L-fucosidase
VTTQYLGELKEFARDSKSGSKRFGAPKRWTVENYKIDCGTSGVKQGLDNYPGYNCLQLGRWEEDDNQMTLTDHANSRLYQRVTLPAGHYYFGAKYHSLENNNVGDKAYLMVASQVLPTEAVESEALAWCTLRTSSAGDQFYGVEFKLTEQQEVVLGWQMDGRQRHTEFRCSEVKLMYTALPQDETAVQSPSCERADSPVAYYSLSGKRLTSPPAHGIYIQEAAGRGIKLSAVQR